MALRLIAVLIPGLAVVGIASLSACLPRGPAGAPAGGNAVQVVETEMRFSPNRIDTRVGQPLILTIVNQGSMRHDLAFPSSEMPGLRGVETLTLPGQSSSLTVTFDARGPTPSCARSKVTRPRG